MKGSIECSYGVIPLQKCSDGLLRMLMVQHLKGHWGFPKGHAEAGESHLETAARELSEETGLRVDSWCENISFQESYHFQGAGVEVDKTVTYFSAYVEGVLQLQDTELSQGAWLLPNELVIHATFPEMKKVCLRISEQFFPPP